MKKKISGLSDTVNEFISTKTITLSEFLFLFRPHIRFSRYDSYIYGTHYKSHNSPTKNETQLITNIGRGVVKIKKHNKKYMKRLIGSNNTTGSLNFFRLDVFDDFEPDKLIKTEIMFSGYTWDRKYRLYDLIYTCKRFIPNLLIDIEKFLLEKL